MWRCMFLFVQFWGAALCVRVHVPVIAVLGCSFVWGCMFLLLQFWYKTTVVCACLCSPRKKLCPWRCTVWSWSNICVKILLPVSLMYSLCKNATISHCLWFNLFYTFSATAYVSFSSSFVVVCFALTLALGNTRLGFFNGLSIMGPKWISKCL